MLLAEVIGTVVATVKDPGFDARTLLLIQPLTPAGDAAGAPIVAVDAVGVGIGERVFYARGKEGGFPFLPTEVPTDAGIVGKVDRVETNGEAVP